MSYKKYDFKLPKKLIDLDVVGEFKLWNEVEKMLWWEECGSETCRYNSPKTSNS